MFYQSSKKIIIEVWFQAGGIMDLFHLPVVPYLDQCPYFEELSYLL